MKVEEIKPYNSTGAKTAQVREMFDSIAPAYDFMNRAMTLGLDRWWRHVAVKLVRESRPQRILDVATGTGDFATVLYKKVRPRQVEGIDLSRGMLDVAQRKIQERGMSDAITLLQADCLDDAELVSSAIRSAYPQIGKIEITSLGVVIGAHCGPGLLTVFYFCNGRTPE